MLKLEVFLDYLLKVRDVCRWKKMQLLRNLIYTNLETFCEQDSLNQKNPIATFL